MTHSKKLNNLGIFNSLKPLDPSRVIFNYSNYVLSHKESNLLTLGLNFKLPIFKINYFSYFLSFEKMYAILSRYPIFNPDNVPNILKDNLKFIANKYFYNFKPHKIFSPFFNKNDFTILKNLSKNDSIIISRPDKGIGVVILNKTDYHSKMNTILNDSSKFKQHTSLDPLINTLRCEDRLNRYLRKLKNNKVISQSTYDEIYSSGSSPGTLYGLPKVHKTGVPLRPILSAFNTHNYNLSKYLVSLLTPFSNNNFSIKNSYQFSQEITSLNSNNTTMYSFDIESLFTNIPINEVIEICLNKIFHNPDTKFHNFTKIQFKQLLELAIKNMFFIFNKTLYEQIDGVAMGSPLAPVLANIFLSHHETIWLQQCPDHLKPSFYKRYVDDTFLLFDNSVDPLQFLHYLNNKHPNIKFTAEAETEGQISFLDININKHNNSFSTSIFRKKTFTGLGTNYFSYIPMKFKISSISTLVHRAYHLSSSYVSFHNEIKFLKKFVTCANLAVHKL